MSSVTFGFMIVLLAVKAFTPSGIPWNSKTNITRTKAYVIGIFVLLLGLGFIALGTHEIAEQRARVAAQKR